MCEWLLFENFVAWIHCKQLRLDYFDTCNNPIEKMKDVSKIMYIIWIEEKGEP
jgi:hypothetical protein